MEAEGGSGKASASMPIGTLTWGDESGTANGCASCCGTLPGSGVGPSDCHENPHSWPQPEHSTGKAILEHWAKMNPILGAKQLQVILLSDLVWKHSNTQAKPLSVPQDWRPWNPAFQGWGLETLATVLRNASLSLPPPTSLLCKEERVYLGSRLWVP